MRTRFQVRVLRDVAGGEGGAAGGTGGAAGSETLLGAAGGEGTGGTEGAGEEGAGTGGEDAAAVEAARVAEETRRAALTDAERTAEDAAKAQDEIDKKGAPEKYEALKMPDGMVMPAGFEEAFTPIAKEFGLSQAKAQKLFDELTTKVQPVMLADQQAKWETQKQTWATESKADKEFGGEAFEANAALAVRAVNTFGTPEFKAALNQFGLGNHPEMIRFMVKVGKAMGEDTLSRGGKGSQSEDKTEEQVQRSLYPTMFKS